MDFVLKKTILYQKAFFAIVLRLYANLDLSLKISRLKKNYIISLIVSKNRLL